ncbi:ribosome silencing factor [uncultured Succinatimonas sp.]|uniref:ribosome silencing factor n=1 Tax=uncultured Succinatimonas sp. TaxID=1262973 RepID=UPI0025E43567|nr:ribosome silencing factor [uncultured Succinatimonas sp.]
MQEAAIKSLESSKALDIIAIDVKEHSSITDTMLICTGTSNRHVCAIADRLVDYLAKHGIHGVEVDGTAEGKWVLADLGNVIVHIMQNETRQRYQLENLYRCMAAGIDEQ